MMSPTPTRPSARGVWQRWASLGCVLLVGAALSGEVRPADAPAPEAVEFFEKKIRPVLIEQCYSCHSINSKKQKGGLLLDSKQAILKGGDSGPALVPGKPADSLLLKAMQHSQPDLKMPPKAKLADGILADFEKWIATGAVDPRDGTVKSTKRNIDIGAGRQYWAFKPVAPAAPPKVKSEPWVRTDVDRFILAALEAKNLLPNPLVGKDKLIRRAYYDLWGIPPTPAEIDAFVKDEAPDAYDRLLDRLLAGDRFGERWARHWLDAVRFAESGGYEFDGDRAGAYFYRDFVIKAFNQDLPFDEFIRLQLAGDQLHPGEFLPTSATGFIVAGPYPGQTTAKTLQIIRYDHLDDMISTVGTSMLGLSLGCARCHEHKYDPIPQEDYYRLIAAFSRTDSTAAKLDPKPEVYRQAKAAFDQAHAPLVATRDKFIKDELGGRIAKWAETKRESPTWQTLDLVTSSGKTPVQKRDDGSLLAGGQAPKVDVYSFTFHTQQKGITGLRLDALTDPSLPKNGPGRAPDGNFILTDIALAAAPLKADAKTKATPVKLKPVQATHEQQSYALAGTVDADKKSGWAVAPEMGKDHAAVFETEGEVGFDGGTVLTVTLKFEGDHFALGRPRLSFTTAPQPAKLEGTLALQHAQELAALLEQEKEVTDQNRARFARWFRPLDAEVDKLYKAVEEHAKKEPQPQLATVFVAAERGGGDVHFLVRGEVDRKGPVSKPGYIQVLMTAPEQDQRWLSAVTSKGPVHPRIALARWMTDTEQGAGHLLARVIVNRLWQHHMGKGIVATPNDFGVQGEPPTHPELLDYLAGELIKNGWKLKPLHKLIMRSAVYQQTGDASDANLKADPANKLWWRRPARRLEAEAIRDGLLAVSGALDVTMYGPGTLDENSLRRSVYLTVKRSKLVPMMQMFDAPEAIQSIGVRSTTTVATQALAMMNSPFVRKRAEQLAARIRPKDAAGLPQAVDDAYLTAVGRRATTAERDRMVSFINQQIESNKNPKALDLALADVCQVLLCSNEFVYID
ncbi:MAG: DUF1553 domain-containing protein [Planctomycetia bacterium]|nr:DUF1553 domain-containing protein [Planctomycetia bacterium]